ncbi:MAG: HD domain-containing protein [Candidatus Aenigmarchaeota archaeon]|nr:HD domain-containing protein [Candidatus Aenigmarchaeota archaeon]
MDADNLLQFYRLDETKLLKMAVFHDLGEAVSGDITPFDRMFEKKMELEGLKTAIKNLPEKMQKEIVDLFLEFEEGKTKEAKIAKMADKLDMYLMLAHYGKKWKWEEYFIKDYENFNSRHFTGLSRETYEKIGRMFHEV